MNTTEVGLLAVLLNNLHRRSTMNTMSFFIIALAL